MLKLVHIFNAPASAPEYDLLLKANTNDEREIVVGIVRIEEPLEQVNAFKPAVVADVAIKGCHGIALMLPHEEFGVAEEFRELPPIYKLFVEGVEVQLRRKVLFICGNGFNWLTVPYEVIDRYNVTPTT